MLSTPHLVELSMEDSWDDATLADEVHRLSRAARARANRALAALKRATTGAATASSRRTRQQERTTCASASSCGPEPKRPRRMSGSDSGQAGSGSTMTLAQKHQPQSQQQCKPPVGNHQELLRVKPATSLALSLRDSDGVGDNDAKTVRSWESVRCKSRGHVVTVGTECSGLESVMAALERLGLGGQTRLRFVCEKDAAARKLILAHQKPDLIYEDITQRPVADMPTCDLYVAGFPCQPWSSAGLKEGEDDRHGRGRIFDHIAEYILSKTPKCFLLENVKGLTSAAHREVFLKMLATLRSGNKYVVTWRVVNTADYGIPQNRPRLYIIGMLRSALPQGKLAFKWPSPMRCKPLTWLLDPCLTTEREQPKHNTVAGQNLKKLLQDLTNQGVPLRSVPYALDILGSNPRAMNGKVPCLTRTRAGCGGYWISTVQGMLTTREMLRLQGLPEHLQKAANLVGVTERQLRQMIGNAMSVNVLVVLLSRLLPAMGLATLRFASSCCEGQGVRRLMPKCKGM